MNSIEKNFRRAAAQGFLAAALGLVVFAAACLVVAAGGPAVAGWAGLALLVACLAYAALCLDSAILAWAELRRSGALPPVPVNVGTVLLTIATTEPLEPLSGRAAYDHSRSTTRLLGEVDLAIDVGDLASRRAHVSKYRYGPTDGVEVIVVPQRVSRP